MLKPPLTVAWISDFPIEWLPDVPDAVRALPRRHPATWQTVLLTELQKDPALRVHVIVLRGPIDRDFSFERNGTVFHVLKATALLRLGSYFWFETRLIQRVCRQIQPDVVHAWGSEKGASLVATRLPYPYVITIQGLFAWLRQMVKLPLYEQFIERVERISLRRARVITAESKFSIGFLRERYPKPQILQAEHAPNRAFRELVRRPAGPPMQFISVGSLLFRKGTDLLFAAMEQLSAELDFKLTIITNPNPDYVAALRATVSEPTWQRIKFRHHLLPQEIAAELETATMLLMPTRVDNSPNAVKEAVVAGVPVVAAAVGGIPDYVVPGKNGILFPGGDLPGFVDAIRAACAHPQFGRGRVDPETHAAMREYLSPEVMAKKFLAAYATALSLPR